MKTYIVSLGCPKNLTDSEVLMGKLVSGGHEITLDPKEAEVIVVIGKGRIHRNDQRNGKIQNKRQMRTTIRCGLPAEIHEKHCKGRDGVTPPLQKHRRTSRHHWSVWLQCPSHKGNSALVCICKDLRGMQ